MALAKRPTTDLAAAVPFQYEAAPEAVDHVSIADSYDLFIGPFRRTTLAEEVRYREPGDGGGPGPGGGGR